MLLVYVYILSTGESAVGKSSLVLRFVKGRFHEYQESTIGGMKMLLLSLVCTSYVISEVITQGLKVS